MFPLYSRPSSLIWWGHATRLRGAWFSCLLRHPARKRSGSIQAQELTRERSVWIFCMCVTNSHSSHIYNNEQFHLYVLSAGFLLSAVIVHSTFYGEAFWTLALLTVDTLFRLHRMHEMLTIVTDVRGVCLSVCLSCGLNSGVIRCSLRQMLLASCL